MSMYSIDYMIMYMWDLKQPHFALSSKTGSLSSSSLFVQHLTQNQAPQRRSVNTGGGRAERGGGTRPWETPLFRQRFPSPGPLTSHQQVARQRPREPRKGGAGRSWAEHPKPRRAQPCTLFSLRSGNRWASFRAQRSHGKEASLQALGTHQPPSSKGWGYPGLRGSRRGRSGAGEGRAAGGVSPGGLKGQGEHQLSAVRCWGMIGSAGGKAWVSRPGTPGHASCGPGRSVLLPRPEPRVGPEDRRRARGGRRNCFSIVFLARPDFTQCGQ